MSASLNDVHIWEEIRTSFCWKTNRLVEGIHKEISKDTALAEFQGQQPIPWQLREIVQQRAETWVQRVYDICCDAYKDRGKAVSEDFHRAVWAYCVEPFIMGQKATDIHHETMSGFLELLLCAVGSPREKRRFLKVSQKDCCFQVRLNVFSTWHARLHHGLPRIDEATAALARYSEVQASALRVVAGLPPNSAQLQPRWQTPLVAQPASPVSAAPQESPSARVDGSSTVLPPSALELILPPSIPTQEGAAPEPLAVSASDMMTHSSGASTATREDIEISTSSLPIRSPVPLSSFEATVGKLMLRARSSCPTKHLPLTEILKIAVQLDDKDLPVLANLEREAARAMAEYNQRHPKNPIKSWRVALGLPEFRGAVRKRFWRAEDKCRKATPSILATSAGTPRTAI